MTKPLMDVPGVALARRIAQVMKEKGITRRFMAEYLGVSQGTVQHWLRTGRFPASRLLDFARVLGVSSQWILGETLRRRGMLEMQRELRTAIATVRSVAKQLKVFHDQLEDMAKPAPEPTADIDLPA